MSQAHASIPNNGQNAYFNNLQANLITCYIMDIGQINAAVLSDVASISGNSMYDSIEFKAPNNTTSLLSISHTPSTIKSANSAINFVASDGSTPLVSISGNTLTKCNILKTSATDLKVQDSTGTTMAEVNNGKLIVPQFQLTTAPSAGYILTSDASGNATWSPDSIPPVGSLVGTTNQIIVSGVGTVWTLSAPQDIATTSSPTFSQLTTTSTINCGGDLNVSGSLNSYTADTVQSGDASFEFLDTNTNDLQDFGIFAKRVTSSQTYYDGLFRNHSTNRFQFYKNYQGSIAGNWITPTLGDLDISDLSLSTWSIGGTSVNSTAADINKVYNITNGTASASKALIFDVNRSISNINSLTATSLTGILTSGVQSGITGIGTQSQNLDMNTHGISNCNSLSMLGAITMNKNAINDALQINTDTSGNSANKAGLQLSKSATYGAGSAFTDVGQTLALNSSCSTDMNQITTQIIGPLGSVSFGANNKISLQVDQPTGGTTNNALYVNGTTKVAGAIDLNSQNITNGGTISATTFSGAFSGTATSANTVNNASQPNITTLGNLATAGVVSGFQSNPIFAGNILPDATVNARTLGSSSFLWSNVYSTNGNFTNVYGALQDVSQPNVTTMTALTSINGQSVSGTDLAKIVGITNGTVSASKAIVVDSSKNITGLGTLSCGAITSSGDLSMASNNINCNSITTYGMTLNDGFVAARWVMQHGSYSVNFGKYDAGGTLRSDIFVIGGSSGDNYATQATYLKSTFPVHYMTDTTQSQTAGWSSRISSGGYTALESVNKPIGLFSYNSSGGDQKAVFIADVAGNCTALTTLTTPSVSTSALAGNCMIGYSQEIPYDLFLLSASGSLSGSGFYPTNDSGATFFPGAMNVNGQSYNTITIYVPSTGTYSLYSVIVTQNNQGIHQIKIDGTSVGTIDAYIASGTANTKSWRITGISLSAGSHTFQLLNASKNASSSAYWLGYFMNIGFTLYRTA